MLKMYVVADPEIQKDTMKDGDDFLILASAGLWSVVSNQDAMSIGKVHSRCYSSRLRKEAHHRGSADNITHASVCFNHHD